MSAKWGRKLLNEIGVADVGEGWVRARSLSPSQTALATPNSGPCRRALPGALPGGAGYASLCLCVLLSPRPRPCVSVSLCPWVSKVASWGLISSSSESRRTLVALAHPVCLSLSRLVPGSALPLWRMLMAAVFGHLLWTWDLIFKTSWRLQGGRLSEPFCEACHGLC